MSSVSSDGGELDRRAHGPTNPERAARTARGKTSRQFELELPPRRLSSRSAVESWMVWPQLQTEPPTSTWPDMPSIRPLSAWPDLIVSARLAGHQSSCGDSGNLSAREQRRPTAAAELWPDLPLPGSSLRPARGVGRRSSADELACHLPASFGRRALAPATFGTRLSDEIARFASGLLREEHVERLDSIRDEMRAGERAVPCCDRCGDFTCVLAGPPPA